MREGLGSSNATTTEPLVWWLRSARGLIGESDDVLAKDKINTAMRTPATAMSASFVASSMMNPDHRRNLLPRILSPSPEIRVIRVVRGQ
jgi:hypothetical protein